MAFSVWHLAIPAGVLLVSFLAFASQSLFSRTEPGSLTLEQSIKFNLLVACVFVSYARSCAADPGYVPLTHDKPDGQVKNLKWCRKCQIPKPPRAHHCKACQRCVTKMDHHCPWTLNCVGHRSFPHFIRFLFFGVVTMVYLGYFLFVRLAVLWRQRHLSSYLGPSSWDLVLLLSLCLVNFMTFFAIFVLLCRTMYSLGSNMTAIEGWEVERHEALLRRARRNGGYVNGPGGLRITLVRHEFPYDVGIFRNIARGMGSFFPWMWFWPFAASPSRESGLEFEMNDFNDPGLSWPPPDPEKMPHGFRKPDGSSAFVHQDDRKGEDDRIAAFKQRQQEDLARRQGTRGHFRPRRPYTSINDDPDYDEESESSETEADEGTSGSNGAGQWINSEGERLADYGVDEAADAMTDDDLIPLSQLIARRKEAPTVR